MRNALLGCLIIFTMAACAHPPASRHPDHVIDALVADMTLEEKAGQMTQLALVALSKQVGTPTVDHILDVEKLEDAVINRGIGSVLNTSDIAFTRQHWHHVIERIQGAAARSRTAVPVLYGIDAVHGANYTRGATLFPHQLGLAATWSPELVEQVSSVTASDVRASGIPWNFAPVVDVARTPLWSRFFETFGEDTHLVSTMGAAAIRGLQADHRRTGVAACLKHFVGYSAPLSGKDRTPAWIPERMLKETFLPPFEAGIEAGALSVMVNSGEVNGIPGHANKALLTNVLRGELGFTGVVVTDWEDVKKLTDMHRIAPTYKDAARMVVEAGVDLCMVPLDYSFTDAVIELVREGALSERRLDASVTRILTMKRDLGLFDAPGPSFNGASRDPGKERALSLRAARQSIVLLRNPGSLPLASDAKVLVTGPGADSVPMLHGAWTWTWQGKNPAAYPADAATVVSELQRQLGAHRVAHSPDGDLADAASADVLIAVVGEQPSVEKPGDIEDLTLERSQIDLVARCVATGRPTVVVLLQGRPRLINEIAESAALIHAGLPGPAGARAIGEILAGTVNPSGKLPFTYPRHAGSLVPYDHKESDRFDKNFGQDAFQPLFPFGHGLSYTSFEYSDLTCSPNAMTDDEPIVITVTVKNTGTRTGRVPVLLFIRDDFASVTPPVRRLRGFDTVTLAPGVSARISFPVTSTDLAFVDRDLNWTTEPGTFRAFVGNQDAAFTFSPSR